MKRTVEKLDELDLRILALLQREGRISKLELSDRVGLSPSACHERVRRLEAAKVIRAEDFARFEQAILQVPEATECVATGIGKYLSYIVTKPVKQTGELPLQHLLGLP